MNFLWWLLMIIPNTILFVVNLVLDMVLSMLGMGGKKGKSRGKRKR